MLRRTASLMPFSLYFPPDPQTMMSDPVLLPAQAFALLDCFDQQSFFFPFCFFFNSPLSQKELCSVSQSLTLETFHPCSTGEWEQCESL